MVLFEPISKSTFERLSIEDPYALMVFLGLCGLSHTGKKAFAKTLQERYNFRIVQVSDQLSESCTDSLFFSTAEELLDHVTERWQENFVWPEISNTSQYDLVSRRPFFVLIQLKASMSERLKRAKGQTLAELVSQDDQLNFHPSGLMMISPLAAFTFINNGSVEQLAWSVTRLGLDSSEQKTRLFRPDWDAYFMAIADFAAKRTNCMKRGVGAVLVQDSHIIATGYNGTARGLVNCLQGGCARCNSNIKCGQHLDSCLCLHAEENALLEAGRARSLGGTLYTTSSPCLSCAKKICQMGVRRVVYHRDYSVEHFTERLLKEAGILLEKFGGSFRQVVIDCAAFESAEELCTSMQGL